MIKKGDLVNHRSKRPFVPSYGLGIVVESWEDQTFYTDVPPHDPDDLMVMFENVTRMITRHECQLVEKCPK